MKPTTLNDLSQLKELKEKMQEYDEKYSKQYLEGIKFTAEFFTLAKNEYGDEYEPQFHPIR